MADNGNLTPFRHLHERARILAGATMTRRGTRLKQNYPNPFNPGTAIRYHLSSASDVRLVVYDVLGREVNVLASGVYLFRLTAGGFAQTRSMIVLR